MSQKQHVVILNSVSPVRISARSACGITRRSGTLSCWRDTRLRCEDSCGTQRFLTSSCPAAGTTASASGTRGTGPASTRCSTTGLMSMVSMRPCRNTVLMSMMSMRACLLYGKYDSLPKHCSTNG